MRKARRVWALGMAASGVMLIASCSRVITVNPGGDGASGGSSSVYVSDGVTSYSSSDGSCDVSSTCGCAPVCDGTVVGVGGFGSGPSGTSGVGGASSAGGSGTGGGEGNSGVKCATDADCDPDSNGDAFCAGAEAAFGGNGSQQLNSAYPTPVCFSLITCDVGDGSSVEYCDHKSGICLSGGGAGGCIPDCTFDGSGAPPVGCAGLDACNLYTYGIGADNKATGIGYCFGGCEKDADCAKVAGQKCDPIYGYCANSANVVTPTIPLGDACTDQDYGVKCNCNYDGDSSHALFNRGACTQSCRVGEGPGCPTGFACDAGLLPSGQFGFDKTPQGLAGSCARTCTADQDCTNGYCAQSAGLSSMTCHVGDKP